MKTIRWFLAVSLWLGAAGCASSPPVVDTPPPPKAKGPLFRIISDGKVGFIDASGQVMISPRFAKAGDPCEGLIDVQVAEGGRWGFVDETGLEVIPPLFSGTQGFHDGLAVAREAGGPKWGYIDRTGRWVIEPQFRSYVWDFHSGFAPVCIGATQEEGFCEGGKWGLVDKTGKITIQPAYTNLRPVENDRTFGQLAEHEWVLLDVSGRRVSDATYGDMADFSEGVAFVQIGAKWGAIDPEGKVVIAPRFDRGQFFQEGLAAVKVGKKWGYVDRKGTMVIEPRFSVAEAFAEGLASASDDFNESSFETTWGFIDKSGKWQIEPKPWNASRFRGAFHGGLALVKPYGDRKSLKPGQYWMAYIDKSGHYVWGPNLLSLL